MNEGEKMTKRTCRYCRREYRAPRGERWHACPDCAPTLETAIAASERETARK